MFYFSFDTIELYAEEENVFSVGTARINITPEVPIPMEGYGGRTEPFKGVHDDLLAPAIAFSDGETKALLISAEIIAIPFSFWENTSKRIEEETGISYRNILLYATHTYGGPSPEPSYTNGHPHFCIHKIRCGIYLNMVRIFISL